MSKHLTSQRYVFKIHSSRLRRAKWNLQLTVNQARENKELIALSESQMMRFIDELNGITNPELHISDIKSQIKKLKFEKNLAVSRPKIKKLYAELDKYQFKKDYVCVVIDKNKDIYIPRFIFLEKTMNERYFSFRQFPEATHSVLLLRQQASERNIE